MVGLVLVSHSPDLVRGLGDLLLQMEPDIPIGIAGGTDDGELGTSLDLVNQALEAGDAGDGAIILFDLGSAEMTAEAALEFLDDDQRERYLLVNAPLVEGALAAVGAAGGGATLHDVAEAARAVGREPASAADEPATATLDHEATLRLRNVLGLHARPAGAIVRALRPLNATVRIEHPHANRAANAASLLDLVGLSASGGTEIIVRAGGPDAERALAVVRTLVEEGFGEPFVDEVEPAPATVDDQEGPVRGAPGLAIGRAGWLRQREPRLPTDGRDRNDLAHARRQVRTELEQARGPNADIFAAQAELLDDPELLDAVDAHLAEGVPVATAWWTAITAQRDRVAQLPGELFAARAADIADVGRRVLRQLGVDVGIVEVDRGQIVVADDLTPAQIQAIHAGGAAGAVTRRGAPTSHMAIVARNLGIPLVLRAGARLDGVDDGDIIIIDGDAAAVEIRPPPDRQRAVRDQLAERARREEARRKLAQTPVTRRDGRRIEVAANVASVQEAQLAVDYGADGVGLLRTEFLFGNRSTVPSEDEQVAALGEILDALEGRTAIIRTLDIGGDKPSAALELDPIRNGFLGVRGIRMSLREPEMFRTQLRALLRLAADHPIRVMFPLVTAVDEVVAAREQLDHAFAELDARGAPAGRPEEVGMMIETPLAALRPEPFLAHVDFVSVGSNDLFAYLSATDRTIDEVSGLADGARGVLDELITTICRAAERAGRWVGVCGEIAAEPQTAARLVELGVTELSMAPAAIPAVKEELRKRAG